MYRNAVALHISAKSSGGVRCARSNVSKARCKLPNDPKASQKPTIPSLPLMANPDSAIFHAGHNGLHLQDPQHQSRLHINVLFA